MILDIDHIALSTKDLEQDIKSIESMGYQLRFIEKEIPNLPIKRNLMHSFQEQQTLALFSRAGSVGIELLDHGFNAQRHSYYTPIFEEIPKEWIAKTGAKRIFDIEFTEARINFLDMDSYINTIGAIGNFRFNKVVIKTVDLRQSIDFWACFGFKLKDTGQDFALLQFSSIFNSQLFQIYLRREDGFENVPYLDDGCFNCIAFVSHSASKEREELQKKGIEVTDVQSLELNSKKLEIFFARGSCGELVEIVGVVNEK